MTNDTPELTELRKRFEEWFQQMMNTKFSLVVAVIDYEDPDINLVWEAFQQGAKAPPAEPVPSEVLAAAKRRLDFNEGDPYDQQPCSYVCREHCHVTSEDLFRLTDK